MRAAHELLVFGWVCRLSGRLDPALQEGLYMSLTKHLARLSIALRAFLRTSGESGLLYAVHVVLNERVAATIWQGRKITVWMRALRESADEAAPGYFKDW